MTHERRSEKKSQKPAGGSRKAGQGARAGRREAHEPRKAGKAVGAGQETPVKAAASKSEQVAEKVGNKLFRVLRRRPYLSVVAAVAAGIGVTTALGVGEVAAGLVFGYATFLMIKKRLRPAEALKETFRARRGG